MNEGKRKNRNNVKTKKSQNKKKNKDTLETDEIIIALTNNRRQNKDKKTVRNSTR